MISIVCNDGLRYPPGGDFFSPDEAFPEYRHRHLSSQPNPVYRAVRQALAQAGLDSSRFGSPEWNPMGEFIRQGSRVFILCNFVYHRRVNESDEAFFAKCTHGSVLRAVCGLRPPGSWRAGHRGVRQRPRPIVPLG